jgi:hypothetical protein
MPSDFQKTVNLKDKAEKDRQRMLNNETEKPKSKAEGIDEVYKPTINVNVNNENDLRQINKPLLKSDNSSLIRKIVFGLAVILILVTVYSLFAHRGNNQPKTSNNQTSNWYAIKLDNGDMYYGQIDNTSADPVVMKNVYYDYDQVNKTANGTNPTGNLRLVKKGKETYGPSGTMEIYHVKIVALDVLDNSSKVLKAILDYENKSTK